MIPSSQTLVRRAPRVRWVPSGESVLLFEPAQGATVHLKDVASLIWRRAEGAVTVHQLAEAVCAEYAVDPEVAVADTAGFVGELLRTGWLEQA